MQPTRLRYLVIAGLVLLAMALAACTRSASTPPPPPAVTDGTPSAQNWQQQTMEAVRAALLTQTAQAMGGAGETTPGEETPAAPATTPEATLSTPIVVATAMPTPTPGRPATYTLQKGEFPYCLARRFNVDPGELLALNGLTPGQATYPGQVLRIPQTGSPFPAQRALRSHPTTYTVQSGDTIYSVACLFGDVDPMAIVAANQLPEPYTLTPGSVINIP